jgi:hypothetical protein
MTSRIAVALSAVAVAAAGGAVPASAADHSAARCQMVVDTGVLPVWARGGFSDPSPRLPHVLGHSGAIAALLCGFPLQSPPGATRNNKILWVSRRPNQSSAAGALASPLAIRAQRMRRTTRLGRSVTRTVAGGPGPSTINLPVAGCWRLTLAWSHRRDTLDLRYS